MPLGDAGRAETRSIADAIAALVRIQARGRRARRGACRPTTSACCGRDAPASRTGCSARHLVLELDAGRVRDAGVAACDAAGRQCARAAAGVRAPRLPLAQPDGLPRAPTPASSISRTPCTAPLTYDLVSLLRDCYVAWPQAQVAGLGARLPPPGAGRGPRRGRGRGAVPALVRPDGRAAPPQGERHLRATVAPRRQAGLPAATCRARSATSSRPARATASSPRSARWCRERVLPAMQASLEAARA